MDYRGLFFPESRFGGFTDIDPTISFYLRVNSLIDSSSTVLDVGCGRGDYEEDPVVARRNLRILRGKCQKVIGIDVDPAGDRNPFLDEFRLMQGTRWPVDDECIDLCICDSVLEHVEDPDQFFREGARVLRQGGSLCLRTTNLLGYVGWLSKMIPNHLHASVLARAQKERHPQDVFPALYRCNTPGRIKRLLDKHGFEHCVYGYEGEPNYLAFSRFLYWLGVLHQRHAPNSLRVILFAFAKKVRDR